MPRSRSRRSWARRTADEFVTCKSLPTLVMAWITPHTSRLCRAMQRLGQGGAGSAL